MSDDMFTDPAPVKPQKSKDDIPIVNGRYKFAHPVTGKDQMWSRVTTYAKTISDTYALNAWLQRKVLRGCALEPGIIDVAQRFDPDQDKDVYDKLIEQARQASGANEGANRGTQFHAIAEQAEKSFDPAQRPFSDYDSELIAYMSLWDQPLSDGDRTYRLRPVSRYTERFVVIPSLNVAGRFDRLLRDEVTGDYFVGDIKTTKNIQYSWLEIGAQLCLYANATHMWNPKSKQYEAMPPVNKSTAFVMHVPIGKSRADIYPVDIETAKETIRLSRDVRYHRTSIKPPVPLG